MVLKTRKFHVIYRNPLPAALVELGFMTNEEEAKKLKSNWYRDEAAKAIAAGIVDYFNWKN